MSNFYKLKCRNIYGGIYSYELINYDGELSPEIGLGSKIDILWPNKEVTYHTVYQRVVGITGVMGHGEPSMDILYCYIEIEFNGIVINVDLNYLYKFDNIFFRKTNNIP